MITWARGAAKTTVRRHTVNFPPVTPGAPRFNERHTADAGLSKLHGVRHAYAQDRYAELTGRPAPAAGGTSSKDLTPEEKAQDLAARLQISHEMGHEREQITVVYLGR